MQTETEPLRMQVIDPRMIQHVMKHPARGYPWQVRELAPVLGCSIGALSHMRTGARVSVPAQLARRFSEAVGVEMSVLFRAQTVSDSDTETRISAA